MCKDLISIESVAHTDRISESSDIPKPYLYFLTKISDHLVIRKYEALSLKGKPALLNKMEANAVPLSILLRLRMVQQQYLWKCCGH